MRRTAGLAAATVAAALVSAGSAYAINHTTDYKTNIGNYRICDPVELDTCTFDEVISPSNYYLANGKKVTVIYTDGGDVQLKIDAATVQIDSYISHTCANEPYTCGVTNTGFCDPPPGGPTNISCTRDRCYGGTNAGAACTVASQCPGGACTGSQNCNIQTCQSGPQDNRYCGGGGGGVSCTSTNNLAGFKIRIAGNENGAHIVGAGIGYLERGNGTTGEGCVIECPVTLGSDGSVNSSGLSGCSTTGDCTSLPLESIFSVELLDPAGTILGIPGNGAARIGVGIGTFEGDPAQKGDCIRNPSQAGCL